MTRLLLSVTLLGLTLFWLSGCGDDQPAEGRALTIWAHEGKRSEVAVIQRQVADFRQLHPDAAIELKLIPQDGYHTRVQAAGASGRLPDVLDLDGPYVAHYAWKGFLQPLDAHLPGTVTAQLLPSLIKQGTWNDNLWCVGTFDSGLGLYVNRSRLPDGTVLPMAPEKAWTAADFTALLRDLAQQEQNADGDGAVLDLHVNRAGEWWTYAFAPVLWSAGTGLIAEDGTAQGTLDSEASVEAMRWLGDWIASGLVDPNTDDRAFVDGRVAFSWTGHWDYPRFHEALGDDLAVVPLPDFGSGSRTGQGSWAWSITDDCESPELAAAWLRFVLQQEEILAMTNANGAVPATTDAVAASALYGEDGDLALFARQLQTISRPRPVTPAYPVITDAFQQAASALTTRGDIKANLEAAAAVIDQDLSDNRGYPPAP